MACPVVSRWALAGPSFHFGLGAPPTASQASVPEWPATSRCTSGRRPISISRKRLARTIPPNYQVHDFPSFCPVSAGHPEAGGPPSQGKGRLFMEEPLGGIDSLCGHANDSQSFWEGPETRRVPRG